MSELATGDRLTYDDLATFPADGFRHELLAGIHVVTPAPDLAHQRVSGALFLALHALVEARGRGVVLAAPSAVRLSEEDGVQPDLSVVLHGSRARLRPREIEGPPDLVVEILSRSTRRADLTLKRECYERCGVGEYWVIDPGARRAWSFQRDGESFGAPTEHRDHLQSPVLGGGSVDLGEVWRALDALGS
ncbi:MAG: Uma2 family endonuclease [Planctomycetes bacterium]|nr:Uma2 family endonuclease [Planctomycetota bacterium]